MRACASPPPVERVGDQARLDRIPGEVAAGGDQLPVAIDLAGVWVRLEQVRRAVATTVVPARVLGVQTLQRPR